MMRDLFMHSAVAVLVTAICASSSAQPANQLTLRNSAGESVVCTTPVEPAFTELGRVAVLVWCTNACRSHSYALIDADRPKYPMINDLDLGKKERRAVEMYLPKQCLPYNPGPQGIVKGPDGGVVECLGVLFKTGNCSD